MTRFLTLLLCLLALAAPCGAAPRHVIVIAMENKDAGQSGGKSQAYIYGNLKSAPYITGTLMHEAARAAKFTDLVPAFNSQPHYILMEAGRTQFEDTRFTCDNDPLDKCGFFSWQPNWTKSHEHLTAQIEAARNPALSWMTYQEGIDPATTGACPIHSAGFYAAKHNPFVYFADVAGSPPSADNPNCIAHTRDLSRFAADMQSGQLANYVFITPNLCHDMHGAAACKGDPVTAGDRFLQSFLPPVLAWAGKNDAVVFIVWDEGKRGMTLPFFAAGHGVKPGHESQVHYSHRSLVKTVERIFGLPVLDAVKDANDLSDMFEAGVLP